MPHSYFTRTHPPAQSSKCAGYYRTARGWLDHEPLDNDGVHCERAAWAWLIEHAVWRPTPIATFGNAVVVKRGSSATRCAIRRRAWGWTATKVLDSLAAHARRHMIRPTHSIERRSDRQWSRALHVIFETRP